MEQQLCTRTFELVLSYWRKHCCGKVRQESFQMGFLVARALESQKQLSAPPSLYLAGRSGMNLSGPGGCFILV